MKVGDIEIKSSADVLELVRAGTSAQRLHQLFGKRIAPLIASALDQAELAGTMSVDHVERILERNTAFERAIGKANLSDAAIAMMLAALRRDKPENITAWCRVYLASKP